MAGSFLSLPIAPRESHPCPWDRKVSSPVLGPTPAVPWTRLPCRSEQVSSRRVGAGGPGPLLSSERNWGSLSSSRSCSARTAWPAQGSRSGRRSGMGKRSLRVARGAERRNTVCCSVDCGGSVCGRAGGQSCHRGLTELKCPLPTPAQNQQRISLVGRQVAQRVW